VIGLVSVIPKNRWVGLPSVVVTVIGAPPFTEAVKPAPPNVLRSKPIRGRSGQRQCFHSMDTAEVRLPGAKGTVVYEVQLGGCEGHGADRDGRIDELVNTTTRRRGDPIGR
jgi:hypothetical protein